MFIKKYFYNLRTVFIIFVLSTLFLLYSIFDFTLELAVRSFGIIVTGKVINYQYYKSDTVYTSSRGGGAASAKNQYSTIQYEYFVNHIRFTNEVGIRLGFENLKKTNNEIDIVYLQGFPKINYIQDRKITGHQYKSIYILILVFIYLILWYDLFKNILREMCKYNKIEPDIESFRNKK